MQVNELEEVDSCCEIGHDMAWVVGDPDGLDDDVGEGGNRYLDAVYDCFASCIHFGCLLDGEYPELVDVVGILLVKNGLLVDY